VDDLSRPEVHLMVRVERAVGEPIPLHASTLTAALEH
jgi:hypothetical protein